MRLCKLADVASIRMQVPEVKVTAQALLPSTSVIGFTLGNGLSFTTFVNTVPINEHRTVNRFALIRCCLWTDLESTFLSPYVYVFLRWRGLC